MHVLMYTQTFSQSVLQAYEALDRQVIGTGCRLWFESLWLVAWERAPSPTAHQTGNRMCGFLLPAFASQ